MYFLSSSVRSSTLSSSSLIRAFASSNSKNSALPSFQHSKKLHFRKTIETLLVDENGSLRSWSEFKKEAYKISNDYNHRWLETEYHQTIANAQMAEKWKGFEANADLFPNLHKEYGTEAVFIRK